MSRGGPYSGYHDQPPAGWTTADQRHWLYPWQDGVDDYFDELAERGWPVAIFNTVYGVTAAQAPASADTWQPSASDPPPESPEPAAAQLLHVHPPA